MNEKITSYARELFEAEAMRVSIPPFTDRDAAFGVDEAYAVQMENVRRAAGMGHKISGKKIGLTSIGMQRQLGVDEPDYGHLFAAMECPGGLIDASALIQPKIEAEIAFVLKKDMTGGNVRAEDVEDATDYVVGAFEIVDSRVADWRIKLADTVADNASSGRYILGHRRVSPKEINLAAVSARLYKGETLAGEGAGSAVMGDPRAAVAWLANKLWLYGVMLKAGEVVLSGAFSAAPPAVKGDSFRAEFTELGIINAAFI